MAIVNSCCCGQSLRVGCFAAGIYSLGLYTLAITLATFHVITVLGDPVLFGLNIMLLVCSGLCVPSSVLLLIGLCVDSRLLLLPWILCTTVTTLIHAVISLYLFCDAKFHSLLPVFLLMDFLIFALNVYCILCVVSQYQEYLAGRGHPGQTTISRTVPSIRLHTLSQGQEISKFIITPDKVQVTGTSSNRLCPNVSWREGSPSRSNLCSELSYISEENTAQDVIPHSAKNEPEDQKVEESRNDHPNTVLQDAVFTCSDHPKKNLKITLLGVYDNRRMRFEDHNIQERPLYTDQHD
ncbi:uncharacterized protein LOC111085609 isoform X2 [Limulus polyphemus]|uniref:Uncharacterized protein LOC111085609 isoform X2 n=1 Tax=Limulus polyphemus TaxID=6850 RepID=A0ABM1SAT7_LIMPO|nr:uncharacterized protein LOC111085609 isoform X2 [Limulus polyphemus]